MLKKNSQLKAGFPSLADKFGKGKKDMGATEVQCAILSVKIANLTEYCKIHKKDVPAKRKLIRLAAIRRRFLRYLKNRNHSSYSRVISELSIRSI